MIACSECRTTLSSLVYIAATETNTGRGLLENSNMEVAAGGGGYSTVEYLALVTGPININIFNI